MSDYLKSNETLGSFRSIEPSRVLGSKSQLLCRPTFSTVLIQTFFQSKVRESMADEIESQYHQYIQRFGHEPSVDQFRRFAKLKYLDAKRYITAHKDERNSSVTLLTPSKSSLLVPKHRPARASSSHTTPATRPRRSNHPENPIPSPRKKQTTETTEKRNLIKTKSLPPLPPNKSNKKRVNANHSNSDMKDEVTLKRYNSNPVDTLNVQHLQKPKAQKSSNHSNPQNSLLSNQILSLHDISNDHSNGNNPNPLPSMTPLLPSTVSEIDEALPPSLTAVKSLTDATLILNRPQPLRPHSTKNGFHPNMNNSAPTKMIQTPSPSPSPNVEEPKKKSTEPVRSGTQQRVHIGPHTFNSSGQDLRKYSGIDPHGRNGYYHDVPFRISALRSDSKDGINEMNGNEIGNQIGNHIGNHVGIQSDTQSITRSMKSYKLIASTTKRKSNKSRYSVH